MVASKLGHTMLAETSRCAVYPAGTDGHCVHLSALQFHMPLPCLPPQERNIIEQEFANGRLRVVAATVAFGMGIDVHSVRAIVHATLPRSLEEYVQQVPSAPQAMRSRLLVALQDSPFLASSAEVCVLLVQIGRAGRDGSQAFCQVYLNDGDFIKLRSLAYSSIVCKEDVEAFLMEVFTSFQVRSLASGSCGLIFCRPICPCGLVGWLADAQSNDQPCSRRQRTPPRATAPVTTTPQGRVRGDTMCCRAKS